MASRRIVEALIGMLAGCAVAAAELPPLGPEALRAGATHVVTAEVKAVRTAERSEPGKPGFVDTLYTIELAVLAVEKGSGLGAAIPARTWRAKARPAGWVGPGGQSVIPAVGERVRAFLRPGDGGALELLLPNGLERFPPGR
jgi:hypothetical protein